MAFWRVGGTGWDWNVADKRDLMKVGATPLLCMVAMASAVSASSEGLTRNWQIK